MRTILVSVIAVIIMTDISFSQFLSPQIDSIPMRDNKKLAADVYLPNGGVASLPTILIQTPYNRLYYRLGLPLGIGLQLNQSNYNIVVVDWRGSFGSSSAAIPQPNRGEDGYDVVEWIALQPWSDGNVGTWGPSALGKVQYLTAKEDPPHLKCIVPVVAAPYYRYSEYYPGGVLRTEYVQQLDQLGFGIGLFVYPNPYYNILWQYAEAGSNYPQSIKIPCFMVAGWYDHNINEMIDFFNAIKANSPVAVRDKHKLLIGPWVHGGHSTAFVGSSQQGELTYPLAEGWGDSLAMMFFDYYLRSQANGWESNSPVRFYQMGSDYWENSATWPPSGLQSMIYNLNSGNQLTIEKPTAAYLASYDYDPADPSPTHGGATLRNDLLQGPYDQSLVVESRTDAAIFSTSVFSDPLFLYGKPIVRLYVSTDRKDTDFAIRLCDVYPDGRSMLLSDGIKRCRFISGYTTADTSSLLPSVIYEIEIELSHLSQVFMPGHRLRIIVTSSNYPRYDNNLNNGGTMYATGDTLIANQVIHTDSINASYIEFKGYLLTSSSENVTNGKTIYPNPSTGIIYFEGFEPGSGWMIFDEGGKEIGRFELRDIDAGYDISDLENGVYYLYNEAEKTAYKIIRLND